MSLELRHLRYFVAVADELHFGRAAERLGMSQPPLSQQIRQLEQQLGARLLDRSHRRVSLTDAGRLFRDEARAILERVDDAAELARRAQRGETGELRIGLTRTVPLSARIPGVIHQFRQHLPAVRLQLVELNSLQQIDALLERRLHVGLLRARQLPELLQSRPLMRDPLVAVLRDDHPALAVQPQGPVDTAALATDPFVLFARSAGAGIHDHILALCRRTGFTPRVAQEASEASTIIGLVAAGVGVSILPASCRHIHVDHVRYVALTDPAAMSEVHVVHRRDEHAPLVQRFLQMVAAAEPR